VLRRLYRTGILDRWRERFAFFERHGLHVVRASYDSPVPDTRQLADERWLARSEMVGVELAPERQLHRLAELATAWRGEYTRFPRDPVPGSPDAFYLDNGAFGPVDAELAYAMMRQVRPHRVIEVGAGFSTRCIGQALLRNAADGYPADFTTIDPAGDGALARVPGVSRHLVARVETVPLDTFASLETGDILFIDSPHVITLGGAVAYLFLDVIPRLPPGVFVHVHDIFLPAAYPREWVMRDYRFYTEQLLLQAFLAFNRVFQVELMGSYLHLAHSAALAAAIPSYQASRDRPGSFWMRS
jgi:hypothetical protein